MGIEFQKIERRVECDMPDCNAVQLQPTGLPEGWGTYTAKAGAATWKDHREVVICPAHVPKAEEWVAALHTHNEAYNVVHTAAYGAARAACLDWLDDHPGPVPPWETP